MVCGSTKLLALTALNAHQMSGEAPYYSSSEQPKVKYIDLTFTGVDESDIIDIETVTIENLSSGASLTILGSNILRLTYDESIADAIDDKYIAIEEPMLYPNPAFGGAKLVVDTNNGGALNVFIYSTNGKLVASNKVTAVSGRNSISIPTQQKGMYIVKVEGCGVKKSIKWMCNGGVGSTSLSLFDTNSETASVKAFGQFDGQFGISTQATDDVPEVKTMSFKKGDYLKFTAKHGTRTSIVYQQPERTHTVTFAMYECSDANGYDYPIVEAGGLLWMAEDLKYSVTEGINLCSSSDEWANSTSSKRVAYENFKNVNSDKGAFFTPQAATEALPSGWRLPTANELTEVGKMLGGMEEVGAALMSSSSNRSKYVGLNLQADGCINPDGSFDGVGSKGFIVTKSTVNSKNIFLSIENGQDAATLDVRNGAEAGHGFRIRGVRPAISAYSNMISFMKSNSSLGNTSNNGADSGFFFDTPLGDNCMFESGQRELVYNLDSEGKVTTVLGSVEVKSAQKGVIIADELKNKNTISENSKYNYLKKIVGQKNNVGRENTVIAYWNKEIKDDWSNVDGKSDVLLYVYGDSTESYAELKSLSLPDFEMPSEADEMSNGAFCFFDSKKSYEGKKGIINPAIELYGEHLKLKSADLNNDGIGEIIVGVGAKVAFLDGATYETITTKDYGENVDVRVTIGDFDGDGNNDIVFMYFEKGNYEKVNLEVYCEGLENLNSTASHAFSYQVDLGHINKNCPMDVAIGDVLGDGKANIVCFEKTAAVDNYAKIQVLGMNAKGELCVLNELKGKTDVDYRDSKHNDVIYFACLGNCEIVLPHFRGMAMPADIFVGNTCWRYDNETFVKIPMPEDLTYVPSGNIALRNVDGVKEEVVYNDVQISYWELSRTSYGVHELTATPMAINFDGTALVASHLYNDGKIGLLSPAEEVKTTGGITSSTIGRIKPKLSKFSYPAFTTVASKDVARNYRYAGFREGFTEPSIYALISAPPYFEGYDYPSEPSTSWGKSSSTGDGGGRTSSNSASVIVGFEQDINVFFTKAASIDFETELKYAYTFGEETTETIEYGKEYSAIYSDVAVVQITPYVIYDYECTTSANPDEIGTRISICVPNKPRTMPLNLEDYMLMRGDSPEIPDLSKVFIHTPGDPFSYPNSPDKIVSNYGRSGILWGTGSPNKWEDTGSGGTTSLTITVSEETNTTSENSFDLDVKLVAGAAGVKAGFGYGHGETWQTSHTEGTGHTYSAVVAGPTRITDGLRNFSWNLCKFNYELAGQKFPVLYYVVRH